MRVKVIRTIDRISDFAAILGGLGMVAILLLTLNEIVFRSFLGHGFRFSWEVSGFAMAASFFLPAGYALRHGAHVRTSALHGLLNPIQLLWVDRLCCLIAIGFLGYAAIAMGRSAANSYILGELSWSGTGISLWIPKAMIAFGLTVFALQCLAEALRPATDRTPSSIDALSQGDGL